MTGEFAPTGETHGKPGRRGLGAAILALAACAVLASAPARPAAAQDPRDDDMGFYKSYVFGMPDDPSEAWQLAYGGRLYDMWWAVLLSDPPEETHPA